jgi:hypothetical protein
MLTRIRNGYACFFQRPGPHALRAEFLNRIVTRPVQPQDIVAIGATNRYPKGHVFRMRDEFHCFRLDRKTLQDLQGGRRVTGFDSIPMHLFPSCLHQKAVVPQLDIHEASASAGIVFFNIRYI